MKRSAFVKMLTVLVAFFVNQGAQAMSQTDTIPSLSATALSEQLAKQTAKPFILDVREPSEFAVGHIDGAKHIPLGSLPQRLSEVPKDKPVVVVCRSGRRSASATEFLVQQGYNNIQNLEGGMTAWLEKCKTNKTGCS